MTEPTTTPSADAPATAAPAVGAAGAAAVTAAAILDALVVLIFAALGRSAHAEATTLAGLWETAWPFLAALALVWLAGAVWRRPAAILRSGLPVWIGTVALGMLARVLFTDGGAALPFVLVATGTLGLGLLGWRAIRLLARSITEGRARSN